MPLTSVWLLLAATLSGLTDPIEENVAEMKKAVFSKEPSKTSRLGRGELTQIVFKPGLEVYTRNPRTWEVEAGISEIQEILSQEMKG